MDPRFEGFSVFQKENFKEFHYHPSEPPASSLRHEEDLSEDCDFSDSILRYINDILMEEDMEDKSCMLQESLDLQAAEKSFYDVLGKKYPPSPEHNSRSFGDNNGDLLQNQTQSPNVSSISQSSYNSSSMVSLDGMLESPNSTLQVPESIWQFNKGVEEASKFIPSNVDLFGNFESYSKGRKFSNRDDVADEDERTSKQVAVCSETSVRSEMLDMVLLCSSGKPPTRFTALRDSLRDGIGRKVQQKGRGKKQSGKKEVVDLRTLLITCAQAVAAGDRNGTSSELLKQIRQHSSPFGDGNQRLAHYLAEALEARLAGPPKLRITGIDFPQPGFKPAERVEETGRRLAAYAEEFKVPFQYKAIAKKWETVRLEELEIEEDEFVVVNCLYRAKNLLDETVAVHSPRNIVLNLIRKINPNLFIHGIINGAFNAPFFVTRFREALFHFSSMFDMLDAIVPREDWERMLIEREILGREALNAIACESWERVERPETVKQWHARILRAGFLQQPFQREIVKEAFERVQTFYHKDFVIDEDKLWLVQGWKGRIIYALSAWKPA
ncbi:hypothetical protein ERO13_D11G346100v2 [Gossypium hirsutum]|nr:hypothetical protein ERO13_D11G346100v2 [Gossypium hirsutum]